MTHRQLVLLALNDHQGLIHGRISKAVPKAGHADREDLVQAVYERLLRSERLPEPKDVPRWISVAIRKAVASFYASSERNGIPTDAVEMASG